MKKVDVTLKIVTSCVGGTYVFITMFNTLILNKNYCLNSKKRKTTNSGSREAFFVVVGYLHESSGVHTMSSVG